MNVSIIRQHFFTFFKRKNHKIVPSAPIVNQNDPTLMFTNAGMNQFKDYFLGNKVAPDARVADTQKCLRVSGKHNDLEEVGHDTYHHTMFEMLGNWSFGDYFKKEAIEWAWELLTQIYKLPKERLYVTVFEGNKEEGLARDVEAYQYWEQWVSKERILDGSRKDNFWEMGETGPCGPSSEIHIDLRSEEERIEKSAQELVNKDHPLVIEIWNLVFIEYNRLKTGKLETLPAKHVDTGMGLERLAMAIQGKKSNYDTDIFMPIIHVLEKISSQKYDNNETTDVAFRVIVDHIRAIAFTITDGQLPSNTGAGYVIRRILRRALRYGYTYFQFREPFLYRLIPVLVEQFQDVFPEIKKQKDFIIKVIQEEETSFLRTLENGLKRFELAASKKNLIDGKTAFELYDTYGFPIDLTELIAKEKNVKIDLEGFRKEMQTQKQRSKKASEQIKEDWIIIKDNPDIAFVGYEHLTCEASIIKYREVISQSKKEYQIVLDTTPFYAEAGGQVGDTGFIEQLGEKISVKNTYKENELIIHIVPKLPQDLKGKIVCSVNQIRRKLIQNNHTATHLLHAALREVLGNHVQQRGSLVNDKLLRFDFSHFSKMSQEEIFQVEQIVNQKIRENIKLEEIKNVPLQEAKEMGAMALFGEKYADAVRVICFDRKFSIELCGGTHVASTGQIGFFKITSESAIAAGIRRIEAVTASEAEILIQQQDVLIAQLKEKLKNPKNLLDSIDQLIDERTNLKKNVEALEEEKVRTLLQSLSTKVKNIDNIYSLIERVDVPHIDALKKLAFDIKQKYNPVFCVLATNVNEKSLILILISEDLVKLKGLHAGNLVKKLAAYIKGGGGGQPFMATAGGKDVQGIEKVLQEAKKIRDEISAS